MRLKATESYKFHFNNIKSDSEIYEQTNHFEISVKIILRDFLMLFTL